MPRDKITALRIEGMRSIERVELDLQGPTVLIGDNGSGKSTFIEACELLRRASSSRFLEEFHQIHGGFFSLLRSGASSIHLGVDVDGAGSSLQLQPAERLERLATNLPNAYAALRSEFGETHWKETLDYIRLGLGNEVETVTLRAGGGGGAHSLWLKLKNLDDQIPPTGIAEGALAYLAFVALFRLPRPDRSLLAFDEPELHLHPELLMRVLDFFTLMSADHPVLLATHSDRLLDGLERPADQIKVCERDPKDNQTRLRALDPEALRQWLDEYRGVGDVRSAGYLPNLLRQANGSDIAPANVELSQIRFVAT